MSPAEELLVPGMDPDDLYREEVYTDRRVGTIRVLTPVTPDGDPDRGRTVHYQGQAQLLTAMGSLPLVFEIDAGSLREAIDRFADAANTAVESTLAELQEMRREAASSIVLPESGAGAGMVPGGGKIKMP